MKKTLMALAMAMAFCGANVAWAGDKPDCSAQETALKEAKDAVKGVAKADLSSCKDKKGKEKAECEKPLKDAAKDAKKAAGDKVKDAQKAAGCCKNPKGKGCS